MVDSYSGGGHYRVDRLRFGGRVLPGWWTHIRWEGNTGLVDIYTGGGGITRLVDIYTGGGWGGGGGLAGLVDSY